MSSRIAALVFVAFVAGALTGGFYERRFRSGVPGHNPDAPPWDQGGTPNDSPVHVQGGSVILKADSGWNASGAQFTSADCVDVTIVEFGGVMASQYPDKPNVSSAWIIRTLVSNSDGQSPDTGVYIRPDGVSCITAEKTNGQHVIVQPIDSSDMLSEYDNDSHRKIYARKGCQAHSAGCESMAAVAIDDGAASQTHTYQCIQSSGCMVWIGKRVVLLKP